MQEKEMTRIDTAVLIDAVEAVIGVSGGELHKLLVAVADRLKEQEATIQKQRDAIKEFERYTSEDAAEITTLRKMISEQAETIERLRIKLSPQLFDQLTRIE